MEIKTITVKEVRNLGNFQNRTVEATGHLAEGENPSEAVKSLIKFVRNQLYLDPEGSESPSNGEQLPIPVVKVEKLPDNNKDEGDIPF